MAAPRHVLVHAARHAFCARAHRRGAAARCRPRRRSPRCCSRSRPAPSARCSMRIPPSPRHPGAPRWVVARRSPPARLMCLRSRPMRGTVPVAATAHPRQDSPRTGTRISGADASAQRPTRTHNRFMTGSICTSCTRYPEPADACVATALPTMPAAAASGVAAHPCARHCTAVAGSTSKQEQAGRPHQPHPCCSLASTCRLPS